MCESSGRELLRGMIDSLGLCGSSGVMQGEF